MTEYSNRTDNRILLVEVQDNPMAKIAGTGLRDIWTWVSAPSGWRPGQPLPDAAVALDAVIVFSRLYEEQATQKLCETILADPRFSDVPVLVAINQYQMPLANRVKELENGGFIFSPVREADLLERLG
jgi:hypothetical protein